MFTGTTPSSDPDANRRAARAPSSIPVYPPAATRPWRRWLGGALTAVAVVGMPLSAPGRPISADTMIPGSSESAPQTVPAPAAPAPTLPGGANATRETFQDWTVTCLQQPTHKRCTISQQQSNARTGQHMFAIEMAAGAAAQVDGILMMPFGLALARGVTIQVGTAPATAGMPFRTCIPSGCIVPLHYDARQLALLRAASTIKVTATADNGEAANFSVSMKGFAAAFDRMTVLTR